MSTETVSTENVENNQTDAVPVFTDPIIPALRDELTKLINAANELYEEFNGVNLDYEAILVEVQRNYSTPEIDELEEKIDLLYRAEADRRHAKISENFDEEDLVNKKAEFSKAKKAIENMRDGYMVVRYGEDVIKGLPSLKGSRGSKSSASQNGKGSGILRIRGYEWQHNGNSFANLSSAVKAADLDQKVVQELLVNQYGEKRDAWPDALSVAIDGKVIDASKKVGAE